MKNIIVGTAGHVDHGKTCLIKALTGIDTDRLKEEKKRGITIELGFANLENDDNIDIGIVDVPGHEKFVNNMLKGYGCIDLVLFIIALDEGVKPQTIEHFEIIKSLNINNLIFVYTKKDIIENLHKGEKIENTNEYINLEKNISEIIKVNKYENSKKIVVSSYNNDGIDELKNLIINISKNDIKRNYDKTSTRLFIDRVFSMDGFGTIITGSLVEGEISLKDDMMLYPSEKLVKVRNIQSHNKDVEKIYAGQRTAVNLLNIKKEDIKRGEILAYPNSIFLTDTITTYIKMFDRTERNIKNLDNVHFIFGSNEEIGRVLLYNKKILEKNEEGYAVIKFDKKIAVKNGDKFIVRFLSPMTTIGGGEVIDISGKKYKNNDIDLLKKLDIKKNGSIDKKIKITIDENSEKFIDKNFIKTILNIEENAINSAISKSNQFFDVEIDKNDIIKVTSEELINNDKDLSEIILMDKNNFISLNYFMKIKKHIFDSLSKFHNENEVLDGFGKEEFKKYLYKFFKGIDEKLIEKIIDLYVKLNVIKISNDKISLISFSSNYNDKNDKIKSQIIELYKNSKLEVPTIEDVLNNFSDKKLVRQIINNLSKDKILLKLSDDYYIHKDSFNSALKVAYDYFDKHNEMRMADFRTLLGTSRKYAILLIDYMDKIKITKLEGDKRVLIKKITI